MHAAAIPLLAALAAGALPAGTNQTRTVEVNGEKRSYVVYMPESCDADRPAPVVLVYHGAGLNGAAMMLWTGLNETAEKHGFIAVYPDGTGFRGLGLTWNAGGDRGWGGFNRADDVAFTEAVLDDLAKAAKVDPDRVYAAGLSNGGMMCYRLASELSGRIAAVAVVGGTMAVDECRNQRPVPVVHFHGTEDKLVPFGGPDRRVPEPFRFHPVRESVRMWAKANGCDAEPKAVELPDRRDDGTRVVCATYGGGRGGAEVVLYTIEGGGHTWPGRPLPIPLPMLGRTCEDISANELIWEFFAKHPRK